MVNTGSEANVPIIILQKIERSGVSIYFYAPYTHLKWDA
jgi:hypothetical protein